MAITCDLPYAFDRGSCKVEFSNITLRSLIIKLSHEEILSNLVKGLNTSPYYGTRLFIKKLENGIFEANLGRTTVTLSEAEAIDLCICVDKVCGEYRRIIIEAEKSLETEDQILVIDKDDFFGDIKFYLFSIRQELWNLMLKFVNEFDYNEGSSEWHIFDGHYKKFIRIDGSKGDRFPTPHALVTGVEHNDLSDEYVHLAYCIPYWPLERVEETLRAKWQQSIGPNGIWTAKFTKDWLLNKFIPQVCRYYNYECQAAYCDIFLVQQNTFDAEIISIQDDVQSVTIRDIDHPRQLWEYFDHIHSWLMHFRVNVPTKLLKPFFAAFIDLARKADPTNVDISYIRGKVNDIDIGRQKGERYSPDWTKEWDYATIIKFFDDQIAKMENVKYINHLDAEYMLRAFNAMLAGEFLYFTQAQLNAMKQALQPLWELCKFEQRFVETQWGWNGLYYEKENRL